MFESSQQFGRSDLQMSSSTNTLEILDKKDFSKIWDDLQNFSLETEISAHCSTFRSTFCPRTSINAQSSYKWYKPDTGL